MISLATARSARKSSFQPNVFMSARLILTLLPILNSSSSQSSLSAPTSSSLICVASVSPTPPFFSNSSIALTVPSTVVTNLPRVIRKESTELSRRLSKFTRMSFCMPFSRCICPRFSLISLSYNSL